VERLNHREKETTMRSEMDCPSEPRAERDPDDARDAALDRAIDARMAKPAWAPTSHDGTARFISGDVTRQSAAVVGGEQVIVTGTERDGAMMDWTIGASPRVTLHVDLPLAEAQAVAERFASEVQAAVAGVVAKYRTLTTIRRAS
jgi:hypothetical protein